MELERCHLCNFLKQPNERCKNCKHVAHCKERGLPVDNCKNCDARARLASNGQCKRCLKAAGMRECVICHDVKLVLLDFFDKQAVCRGCKNPYRHMEASERKRFLAYSDKYGLTYDQYCAIHASQNGLCAICGENQIEVVDHDHGRGSWRGLLCSNCNCGLGLFGDSAPRLRAAAAYLVACAAAAGSAGSTGG